MPFFFFVSHLGAVRENFFQRVYLCLSFLTSHPIKGYEMVSFAFIPSTFAVKLLIGDHQITCPFSTLLPLSRRNEMRFVVHLPYIGHDPWFCDFMLARFFED